MNMTMTTIKGAGSWKVGFVVYIAVSDICLVVLTADDTTAITQTKENLQCL